MSGKGEFKMVAQIQSDTVNISYAGDRYYLGFGDKFFAIYDKLDRRDNFSEPVQVFEKTQEGWEMAWKLFNSWEPHCHQIPVKTININSSKDSAVEDSSSQSGILDKNYLRPSIVLKSKETGVPAGRYTPITLMPLKSMTKTPIVGNATKSEHSLNNLLKSNAMAILHNVTSILKAVLIRIDDLIQNPKDAIKYHTYRLSKLNKKSSKSPSTENKLLGTVYLAPNTKAAKTNTFKKAKTTFNYNKQPKFRASVKMTILNSILIFGILAVLVGGFLGYRSYQANEALKAFPQKSSIICSSLTARVNPLVSQLNSSSQSPINQITDITNIQIAQSDAYNQLSSIEPSALKANFQQMGSTLKQIKLNETALSNAIAANNGGAIIQLKSTLAQLNQSLNSLLLQAKIGNCVTAGI
jgi:hypothetical protein